MEWIAKLLPELWVFVNILLFLGFVGFYKSKNEMFSLYNIFNFSCIVLVFSLFFQLYWLNKLSSENIVSLDLMIGNLVIYSNGFFEIISKLLISIVSIFIVIMFGVYFGKGNEEFNHRYFRPDLLPLYLTVILGSFVLVSSNDFLTFLIGFELIAVPSYFMIAMDNRNKFALEGSMKYFLIGSLATISIIIAILIFYIYSGSLVFANNFALLGLDFVGVKIAFIFLLIGILIKLAAFPFSFWIQDAYFGSRSPYLLVISTLPKLVILIVFVKILSYVVDSWVSSILGLFSIFSMIMGTFWALTSNDLKKILAFSTVANIGYILIPFSVVGNDIISNSQALAINYFYILQYVLSTMLFISVLLYLEEKYDSSDLSGLRGVLSNNPVLGIFMIISLVSLAGLPPTAGFIGKFLLFSYSYTLAPILVWIGIITSLISLYFYYRIAQYLYVKDANADRISVGFLQFFSNSFLSVIIILIGFFPWFVINIIYFLSMSLLGNIKL
ncbi:MAG: proton-conducting transporter membrane subunit [Candidatus Calescibacterium sp.]|nr:hypothetical protein [Candidatus Calescibacterium sp.]MDW8133053.1 proton-conducting transporter membrane subunit [Candidatus Calescibacterium sp.]